MGRSVHNVGILVSSMEGMCFGYKDGFIYVKEFVQLSTIEVHYLLHIAL